MIRIGVFNGSGRSGKPEPMIIKSEGSEPDQSLIAFYASHESDKQTTNKDKKS